MIWTEEEDLKRQFDNVMYPKGKTCANCQWSSSESNEIITCGHHVQNFTSNSFCGYWTSKDDPKVKAYFERRKVEIKNKHQNQ